MKANTRNTNHNVIRLVVKGSKLPRARKTLVIIKDKSVVLKPQLTILDWFKGVK